MHHDSIIKVENISKKFCKTLKYVMTYGTVDITKDFFNFNSKTERLRKGEFWAVDDISFELTQGKTLGIIGPNGSGKSTTLKMLNGIFMPDKGKIQIKGRIGALIEIGAGFHPMLTGRENIYVNGSILGMSKREIDTKFDEIVDFADIGEFLESPVKHYSSGMYVRLEFSIAVHCEPDILLVDEVLAVGDAHFYNKCTAKIKEMTDNNVSIVLVSHNMWLIKTMCDSVIVLNYGKSIKEGNPIECIYEYSRLSSIDIFDKDKNKKKDNPVIITQFEIKDEKNKIVKKINTDDCIIISAKYYCKTKDFYGHFIIRVTTPDGYPLYTSYSDIVNFGFGDGIVAASIPSFSLLEGEYRLWIAACGKQKEEEMYHAENVSVIVKPSPYYPDSKFGIPALLSDDE